MSLQSARKLVGHVSPRPAHVCVAATSSTAKRSGGSGIEAGLLVHHSTFESLHHVSSLREFLWLPERQDETSPRKPVGLTGFIVAPGNRTSKNTVAVSLRSTCRPRHRFPHCTIVSEPSNTIAEGRSNFTSSDCLSATRRVDVHCPPSPKVTLARRSHGSRGPLLASCTL